MTRVPLPLNPRKFVPSIDLSLKMVRSSPSTIVVAGPPAPTPVAPPAITITPDTSDLTVGDIIEMTVTLSEPPTSDLLVTLVSSDEGVLTFDVTSIIIPAGELTGTFNATVIASGSATVTGTAQSYTDGKAKADAVEPPSTKLLVGNDNFSVVSSTDGGATWGSEVTVFTGGPGYVTGLVQLANGTVLACDQSGQVARSTDGGATWTQDATPLCASPFELPFIGGNSFCYDGDTTLVVAVRNSSTNNSYLYASTSSGDSGSWSQVLGPINDPFTHTTDTSGFPFVGVAWSGMFVAFHHNQAFFTSPDGTTWTEQSPFTTVESGLLDVRGGIGSDAGTYAYVGNSASTGPVSGINTSPAVTDFFKHYQTTSGLNGFQWIALLNGVFVAVVQGDTNIELWRSTDAATTWANVFTFGAGETAMFLSVAADKFYVGVTSADLSSASTINSADGSTWSSRTTIPGSDGSSNFFEPGLISVTL